MEYSVGFAITEKVRDVIASAPKGIWTKQALATKTQTTQLAEKNSWAAAADTPAYPLADPSNTRDDPTSAPNY